MEKFDGVIVVQKDQVSSQVQTPVGAWLNRSTLTDQDKRLVREVDATITVGSLEYQESPTGSVILFVGFLENNLQARQVALLIARICARMKASTILRQLDNSRHVRRALFV
ncbi:MAG: hypothetical protein Q8P23_04225 [bacterium]|nr:hypothetical protein [bacterium]